MLIVTVALPLLVESCTDVAVTSPLLAPLPGVKIAVVVPATVPPVALQVTAGLNEPVPLTVGVQIDMAVGAIDAGAQDTVTPVMVDAGGVVVAAMLSFPMYPHDALKLVAEQFALAPNCTRTQLKVGLPEEIGAPRTTPVALVACVPICAPPVPFAKGAARTGAGPAITKIGVPTAQPAVKHGVLAGGGVTPVVPLR